MTDPDERSPPVDGVPSGTEVPPERRFGWTTPSRPLDVRDAGEEGTTWHDILIRTVALVTVGYSAYYLFWRWTETLNPDALWFSIPLVAAETWALVTLSLLVFTAWRIVRRPPVPVPEGYDVDVFITTYDESLAVVRKTAVAARNIHYPHTTWILDDGCRAELRELAQTLGIEYIQRESSEHAKAGNLNNALGQTDADFILQLDADHVPIPLILDRLLGYFEDDRVAFVQSPQDFYNTDSYTHVMDDEGRRVWEEQRLFFDIIQVGKDHWNSAFFCGSCGVIRRAALDEIGGFSTETIVEDLETSILLHARGWKSVYVSETLAYGLSPGSAGAYHVQRLRWGQGAMQVLRKFNPLTLPGLTWPQRINYLSSVTYYLDGIQKLVFILAPIVYFFTGVLPVRALDFEFLARFFPYLFLVILTFELVTRGRGYLWLSERYSMAKWPIYLQALASAFSRGRLEFEVTPKGEDDVPVGIYAPQLAVVVLTPLALLFATLAYGRGWIDYGAPGWESGAFILNAFWILWNAYFAWEIVRLARSRRQAEEYRFRVEMPVRIHFPEREGMDAAPAAAVTQVLSSGFLRLLSPWSAEIDEHVCVELPLATGPCDIEGRVVEVEDVMVQGIRLREVVLDLEGIAVERMVDIEIHCLHHSVPVRAGRYLPKADLFEDLVRFFSERRRERRIGLRLPAQVGALEEGERRLSWHDAILEEFSGEGALLLVDREYPDGAWIRFQVPGIGLEDSGMIRHLHEVEAPVGSQWMIGVERRSAMEGEQGRGSRRSSRRRPPWRRIRDTVGVA